MRTTVIIRARGQGYIATVHGRTGPLQQGARVGLTNEAAAATAAELMLQHAASNPEGGDLMAPAEVLACVPVHLHHIKAQPDA